METNPIVSLPLLLFLLAATASSAMPSTPLPPPLSDYLRFVADAASLPPFDEYEYIVVGGGTAGCPLAATLSSLPGVRRVLLLERGAAPAEFPSLATADGFLRTLSDAESSGDSDSPAQSFVSEDGVPSARGRVLGGSSAINAGFYSRAHPAFFADGAIDWDMVLVNASYEWVERAVVSEPVLQQWQEAVRDALLEAGFAPWNGFDVRHVPGTKIGGSTFDAAGWRRSSADLLSFARPGRLQVALRATVERVLLNFAPPVENQPIGKLEQPVTVTGVVYRDLLGHHHHAALRSGGEVILCAGALGSPQLLLLSGIGPRNHLASWGIPVSVDLPGVGNRLADNPRNGLSIVPPPPMDLLGVSLIQVVGVPPDLGSGNTTSSFIEAASTIIPFRPAPHSGFLGDPPMPLYYTVATLMEKVPGSVSSGTLQLTSLNAHDVPAVRFNYFSQPAELASCVSGVRRLLDILETRAMDSFRSMFGWRRVTGRRREFRYVGAEPPMNRSDDARMAEFCMETVSTIWHYHGGCVAGDVVDGEFRVVGVSALRVVDGSTFAVSPGTNPQATVMMMGRYVGLKIGEERRLSRRRRRPLA